MEKREGGALSRLMKTLRLSNKELIIIICGVLALVCIAVMPSRMLDDTDEAPALSVSTQLEERLASTLSQIKGAGRVQVMVTYTQEENQGGWLSSSQGNKKQEVVGVIIVAQGARDIGVTFELITAAKTVLGVKASMVKVFVMNDA